MSWKLRPDPMGEERNPFQVYLLCLAIFSGMTVLISDVPNSAGSIEAFLTGWEEALWGALLVGGSILSLAGMYWPWDPRDGLLMKRFGFTTLSVPLVIYAIALVARFGFAALSLSLVIAGFAVASFIQARRVNKRVKHVIEKTVTNGDGNTNGSP